MKSLGDTFEARAADWLQRQGLIILQRNFNTRYGEIDIIARDGNYLVFIEVRARSHPGYAGAAASISTTKQCRIIRAAQIYLREIRPNPPCRFDVVAFEPRQSGPRINWIRSAFSA